MTQIGRKIYYDLATGSVIQDTGECQGGLVTTMTQNQDFAFFPALIPLVPSNVGVMLLGYSDSTQALLNSGSYHVDIPTKTLVIYPHFTFVQDKAQITGNGVDTLTITVTTSNAVADTIKFTVNGTTQSIPTDVNGKAVFTMKSSAVGTYTINISSTYYGSSSTTVKVV